MNHWDYAQSKPLPLSWSQLLGMDEGGTSVVSTATQTPTNWIFDFTASPNVVRALAEGERLSFGHMFNPAFATEIFSINPLLYPKTEAT